MATLIVTDTHDYTADILSNIDEIVFNTSGPTQATFVSSQFGGSGISNDLSLTGDGNNNWVAVYMTSPGSFSLAGWSFWNWSSSADAVLVHGTDGADAITGGSGRIVMDGHGGADTLIGGAFVDSFYYSASSDIVPGESVDGGASNDALFILLGGIYDFSLMSVVNVESIFYESSASATAVLGGSQIGAGAGAIHNIADVTNGPGPRILIVDGSSVDLSIVTFVNWTAGTDLVTINGTAGANVLTGSSQNDSINGGLAADYMTGWAGDDTYFVGQLGDVVDESLAGGDGTDTVRSSISFSLADAVHAKGSVERLILTGAAAINGTGNSGLNVIIGNVGQNIINGGGGEDTIFGRGGADHLAGGGSNDNVWGGGGSDILFAGSGHDTLTGGGNSDAFVFSAVLAPANLGIITDFLPGNDVIKLKHTVFTKIATGALSADAFHLGANAADKEDRIIYHQASDSLYYDKDGNGPQAKVLFATIENDAVLSAADFIVIA